MNKWPCFSMLATAARTDRGLRPGPRREFTSRSVTTGPNGSGARRASHLTKRWRTKAEVEMSESKQVTVLQEFRGTVDAMGSQFLAALPAHVPVEKFKRTVI